MNVGEGFEKLQKAIEFERQRSRLSIPLAKPILALLAEAKPHFTSKDRTEYPVDRRDLEKVVAILGKDNLQGLSLPIYLNPAPQLGQDFYQLLGVDTGSEMERKQSKMLFGLLEVEPRSYLYGYEVQRLKRAIPSVVHVLLF